MLSSTNTSNKWIAYLSYSMFLCVLVLAIVYAKERLFADSSYYFFHSINQGYPQVDHDRITLLLAQTLPLIGSFLGASVKTLVYLHSIGHVLFFFFLFGYVYYYKKLPFHGLALAILSATGVTVLFFSPMLEIWYGIALAIVLDAELKKPITSLFWRYSLLTLLVVFITLSHPENFGVAVFIFILNAIQLGTTKKSIIWFSVIILTLLTYKFFTFSEYEAGKVNNGLNAENNQFYSERTTIEYYFNWFFMLLKNYYDCLLILVIGIFIYFKNKEYKPLLFVFLSIVGFSFIVHYTNKADEYTRYIESVHLPLVAMSLIVLIDVFNRIIKPLFSTILLGFLVLFFSSRVYFIYEMGHDLTKRTELIESFIELSTQKGIQKTIVTELHFESLPGYFKTWSISIESLILSTMRNPDYTISIITDDDWNHEDNHTVSNGSNFILRRWEIYHNNWLNTLLFILPVEDYEFLK
jgi:hypothetical protein